VKIASIGENNDGMKWKREMKTIGSAHDIRSMKINQWRRKWNNGCQNEKKYG